MFGDKVLDSVGMKPYTSRSQSDDWYLLSIDPEIEGSSRYL